MVPAAVVPPSQLVPSPRTCSSPIYAPAPEQVRTALDKPTPIPRLFKARSNMPPWSPASNSQYLSTVLNDSNAQPPIPSHAAAAPPSTSTPPRPRQTSAHFPPQQPQTIITPAQRSAQARGKCYAEPPRLGLAGNKTKLTDAESYASRERRNEAAAILDSQELLIWYAASRHESVSATRRWFRNVVLGVEQDERVCREEWEVRERVGEVGVGSPKGKGRVKDGRRDGTPKKRYSGGGPSVVVGEGSGSG